MDTAIQQKPTKPRIRLSAAMLESINESNSEYPPFKPGDWVETKHTGRIGVVSKRCRDVLDGYTYTVNIPETTLGKACGQIKISHPFLKPAANPAAY